MVGIRRDPVASASEDYDLVVIGGGIFGTSVLLEASRRGWKTLLVERDDFGGATSLNSLRILHGGLRYLQTLDLSRFRRSVREQSWWQGHFPELVEPLPCLMPLYNQGMHRTDVLGIALKLNDVLANFWRGQSGKCFEPSRILTVAETRSLYPGVDFEGLRGAATWTDLKMSSPQRLLIELLRWGVAAGGMALNYMCCIGAEVVGRQVRAIRARCEVTGQEYKFRTKYVINCAGPWGGEVAGIVDGAAEAVKYAEHAMAFNLVVNRPAPSSHGLAVSARGSKSQVCFLVPYGDKTMAGTCHLPPQASAAVSREQVDEFLSVLNQAVPEWTLDDRDVERVMMGRLPPLSRNSAVPRKSFDLFHGQPKHAAENISSVVGPKYTTARFVAAQVVNQVAKRQGKPVKLPRDVPRPPARERLFLTASNEFNLAAHELRRWMDEESVIRPDDLLRRDDFSEEAVLALKVAAFDAEG